MKEDILLKLDLLSEQIRFIEERSPQIIAEYRTKLEEKNAGIIRGYAD